MIQLKILKLLVFLIVFLDPVVKPRGDTLGCNNTCLQ
ncbi:MAG: palindromic element RPE4 domain-containing protein [Rickettsia endosymbiont of Eriopis connexa]|nr:palindromic element RPE4 domain-containing protein [Rickettsia endosymbiont of Eriopis connexa]